MSFLSQAAKSRFAQRNRAGRGVPRLAEARKTRASPSSVEYRRDEKSEPELVELKADDEPILGYKGDILARSSRRSPNVAGVDTRPILTCFIGIILAIVLNKLTSFYTHTTHEPVKTLARACQTGHATNIIQGFAVGYESAVMATLVLATAIALSVFCYHGSLAGVRRLWRGHGGHRHVDPYRAIRSPWTCSAPWPTMPTASARWATTRTPTARTSARPARLHAPEEYKRARQILADLDAVGNTTKAETKGIAIGSAVIAAVSHVRQLHRRAWPWARKTRSSEMTTDQYNKFAALLTVANPMVFIGLLIGGVVPWLFSSMLIRAVGRAAFYIIKECRIQFRDPGDHGRHEEAQLRPRGRYLHQRRPGRIDRPGAAGRAQPDPRRRAAWPLCLGRLPGRHDRLGRDARRCSWPTPAAPGTTPRR